MIRTPIPADRAQIRTILRQNMALMERETLAGMTAVRVLAILNQFEARVHIDDATGELDGVWLFHIQPQVWECRVAFTLAGVGQARFKQIWLDFELEYYTRAKLAGVPLLMAAQKLPQAVGIKLIMDAHVAAGHWNEDTTARPGYLIYSGTPDQALAGMAGV